MSRLPAPRPFRRPHVRAVWLAPRGGLALALVLPLLVATAARAEPTRTYHLEGFGSFLDGNPETTAVTEKGGVRLGPLSRELRVMPDANFVEALWWRGHAYLADAEAATVVRVDTAGATDQFASFPDQVLTTMAVHGDSLLVAVGPGATLYKLDHAGHKEAWVNLSEEYTYLWDLTTGPDGRLLAATGDPGSLIAIDAKGKVETLFKSPQRHLSTVHWSPAFGVLAGGGEKAVVYQARDKEFRALLAAPQREVTALAVIEDRLYVAAVSGAARLLSARSKDGESVRSQVFMVRRDGSYEGVAGSTDEVVTDMLAGPDGQLLVLTGATREGDPRGRVYALAHQPRLITMLWQSLSERITRLVPIGDAGGRLLAVSAGGGRLDVLTSGPRTSGEFVTPVFDTGLLSDLGQVNVDADLPAQTRVQVQLRVGQTDRPEDGWQPWSSPLAAPGGRVKLPAGRFMQAKLILHGAAGASPEVYRLQVAYRRRNLPPVVEEVGVLGRGVFLEPLVGPDEDDKKGGRKGVRISDKKLRELRQPPQPDEGDSSHRALQSEQPGARTAYWLAGDPNGDRLRYTLEYRRLGDDTWRELARDLTAPFFPLVKGRLADGRYLLRVTASDRPSNQEEEALTESNVSRLIEIDNSPPRLDPLQINVSGTSATVRLVAVDATSRLSAARCVLDAGEPVELVPEDRLFDQTGETFAWRLTGLAVGRHLVTCAVSDEAGNEAYREAELRVGR